MKIRTMLFVLFVLTIVLTAIGVGIVPAAVVCGISCAALGMLYYLDLDLRGK